MAQSPAAGSTFQNRHIHGWNRSVSLGGRMGWTLNPAGIDRLGQAVDDRPLARGVPAFEDDDHRHSGRAGQPLALAQFLFQKRKLLVIVFLGNRLVQIDKFQHDKPRKPRSRGERCLRKRKKPPPGNKRGGRQQNRPSAYP